MTRGGGTGEMWGPGMDEVRVWASEDSGVDALSPEYAMRMPVLQPGACLVAESVIDQI